MLKLHMVSVTFLYDAGLDELKRPYKVGKCTEPKCRHYKTTSARPVEMDEPCMDDALRKQVIHILKSVTGVPRRMFYDEEPEAGRTNETIDTLECVTSLRVEIFGNVSSMTHSYDGVMEKRFDVDRPGDVFANIDEWASTLQMPDLYKTYILPMTLAREEGAKFFPTSSLKLECALAENLACSRANTARNERALDQLRESGKPARLHELAVQVSYSTVHDEKRRPYITGKKTEPKTAGLNLHEETRTSPDDPEEPNQTMRKALVRMLKKIASTPRSEFYEEKPEKGRESERIDALHCLLHLIVDAHYDVNRVSPPGPSASMRIVQVMYPALVFADIDEWAKTVVLPHFPVL